MVAGRSSLRFGLRAGGFKYYVVFTVREVRFRDTGLAPSPFHLLHSQKPPRSFRGQPGRDTAVKNTITRRAAPRFEQPPFDSQLKLQAERSPGCIRPGSTVTVYSLHYICVNRETQRDRAREREGERERDIYSTIYATPPLMYPRFVLELCGMVVVSLQTFPISTILRHMQRTLKY